MLESYLRNDSLFDMGRQISLYRALLQLVRCIVSQERLLPLLDNHNQSTSIYDLINNLGVMADVIMKRTQKAKSKEPKDGKDKDDKEKPKEPKDNSFVKLDTDIQPVEEASVSDEDQLLLAGGKQYLQQ
jgi:hypothetical protein